MSAQPMDLLATWATDEACPLDEANQRAEIYAAVAELIEREATMRKALEAIAAALDAPRDRLYRIQPDAAQSAYLYAMRQELGCGPCMDNIDGSVHVARAALARIGGAK
jgi:hypothetical protein